MLGPQILFFQMHTQGHSVGQKPPTNMQWWETYNLQVWYKRVTARSWPPEWQGAANAWSFIHFEELQSTLISTYSGLVGSAGYFWRPELDIRNANSLRWFAVTHALLNCMEGSHSILLIPHPEFNPHAAWPRATVSAFHYSSPSNSAFKAVPKAVHLLQQWKQSCLLLAE